MWQPNGDGEPGYKAVAICLIFLRCTGKAMGSAESPISDPADGRKLPDKGI